MITKLNHMIRSNKIHQLTIEEQREARQFIENNFFNGKNKNSLQFNGNTPDFLFDFKFKEETDIAGKLRALKKYGYDDKLELSQLKQIVRKINYHDHDSIRTIIQNLGIKNLKDIHEFDDLLEIETN